MPVRHFGATRAVARRGAGNCKNTYRTDGDITTALSRGAGTLGAKRVASGSPTERSAQRFRVCGRLLAVGCAVHDTNVSGRSCSHHRYRARLLSQGLFVVDRATVPRCPSRHKCRAVGTCPPL